MARYLSEKAKRFVIEGIPFVLYWYGKMSVLDNLYEPPWLDGRYATM